MHRLLKVLFLYVKKKIDSGKFVQMQLPKESEMILYHFDSIDSHERLIIFVY